MRWRRRCPMVRARPSLCTMTGSRATAIFPEADQAKILGHILAHEIVHMLQGVARHSNTGLMKARWDTEDLRTISRTGLGMAAEDRQFVAARFAPTAAEGTR